MSQPRLNPDWEYVGSGLFYATDTTTVIGCYVDYKQEGETVRIVFSDKIPLRINRDDDNSVTIKFQ